MTSINSQHSWSELLCCAKCRNVFSKDVLPLNLACGHLMCFRCATQKGVTCPVDKVDVSKSEGVHYINTAVLSILLGNTDFGWLDGPTLRSIDKQNLHSLERIEPLLFKIGGFLYKLNSEKGATLSSNCMSRSVQRKIFSLLTTNILMKDRRVQFAQNLRSMSERIVSELILYIQSNSNLSSSLWCAVRARGCQFLGPAMQEDVLKLIMHVLKNGENIARKNLVLYVVETLTADYPHISKTCVGHVVQLLYRASCFNVIKRDGQSSLMQLKEQFRDYDSLRAEHDAQIVQIAMEAGLRISPDQWSSLLYGDLRNRNYMQSICDRLSNNSLKNAVTELQKLVSQQAQERELFGIENIFKYFDVIVQENLELLTDKDFIVFENLLLSLYGILQIYSKFIMSRNEEREQRQEYGLSGKRQNFSIKPRYFNATYQGCDNSGFSPVQPLRDVNTPLRAINIMALTTSPPMDIHTSPITLLPYAHQIQQPSLSSYFEASMPAVGSPPNFVPSPMPLNFSPTQTCISIAKRDSCGQKPLETISANLIPVLPASPIIPRYHDPPPFNSNSSSLIPFPNPSTSPIAYNTRPSFIVFGNGTNPDGTKNDGNLLIGTNQPVTPAATIISTSPPTYQLSSTGGIISNSTYPIPVQSQQVIVYGSTPPYGSPPLLLPQFSNWVTPLDSGGTLTGSFGYNLINSAFASDGSSARTHLADTSFESENESASRHSRRLNSSHANAEDDDYECHVSFTVAASVLNDDKQHRSGYSSWTTTTLELSPISSSKIQLSQLLPIPLSPSIGSFATPRSSTHQASFCTLIPAVNMNIASSTGLVNDAPKQFHCNLIEN